MKILLRFIVLAIVLFGLFGCDLCQDCPHKGKRNGDWNYTIKVCPIGTADDDACVIYKADTYDVGSRFLIIKNQDGTKYRYNLSGWAIITVKH